MKTGFKGTFVISWAQTELDGQRSAPVGDLGPGRAWFWDGEAVRVDGPSGVLPLGASQGEADLRRRVALTVRRLMGSIAPDFKAPDPMALQVPMFDEHFVLTNGFETWNVAVVGMGPGRKPLLMFHGEIPPRQTELWVVRHNISAGLRGQAQEQVNGVICFTPGTMIMTPDGARDVASLTEGDKVQTKDNGASEVLWIGKRHVTGARLKAMPHLLPIRLRAGALDKDVPDAGLLVSPDHRMVLQGARARALYSADEVLVTARDLVDDYAVIRDHSVKSVTYIHMMLMQHEVVFANGVATESFHPASAALATMQSADQVRLFDKVPELQGNAHSYGPFARRLLTDSEAAILRHDA